MTDLYPTLVADKDTLLDRYANRVTDTDTGCRLWTGQVNNWGYGVVSIGGIKYAAQRVFYELLVGPIPDGMVIDHTCRVHECVNVEHMQVVTRGENIALGRLRNTHCRNGHLYDDENTQYSAQGWRMCRVCVRIANHTAYIKRQER